MLIERYRMGTARNDTTDCRSDEIVGTKSRFIPQALFAALCCEPLFTGVGRRSFPTLLRIYYREAYIIYIFCNGGNLPPNSNEINIYI